MIAGKINYTGEAVHHKYIERPGTCKPIPRGKLAFQKTREPARPPPPGLTLPLGIMPDYTFSGSGVRVDGVTDGRPAQKAGIKTGDIIIQLGSFPHRLARNLYAGVSQSSIKGDKTTVKYKRGEEMKEGTLSFKFYTFMRNMFGMKLKLDLDDLANDFFRQYPFGRHCGAPEKLPVLLAPEPFITF